MLDYLSRFRLMMYLLYSVGTKFVSQAYPGLPPRSVQRMDSLGNMCECVHVFYGLFRGWTVWEICMSVYMCSTVCSEDGQSGKYV